MKTMLKKTLQITAVLLTCLSFQTCKKDLIVVPETSKDEVSLLRQDINSPGSSYQVTTFVSEFNPIGDRNVSFPSRICSAADGTMYVVGGTGRVYKISADGRVSNLTNIHAVSGVKAGQNGVLYLTIGRAAIAPRTPGRLIRYDRSKGFRDVPVTTNLSSPWDLAIAPDSTIYIVDKENHCVVKVKKDGTSTVFAGEVGQPGNADGQGENSRFNNPTRIRYANDGMLWVVDGNAQSIRRITLEGSVSTFYTLNPNQQSTINDVAVTKRDKDFNLSTNENAFISVSRSALNEPSSQRKHQILHLAYNKVLTPITSLSLEGSQDGDALQATFRFAGGLTVNPNGVFVTDLGNHAIRKISRR